MKSFKGGPEILQKGVLQYFYFKKSSLKIYFKVKYLIAQLYLQAATEFATEKPCSLHQFERILIITNCSTYHPF